MKAVLALGNAKLYVTGDFVIPSSWEIKIADGASFKVYVGTITGSAVKGEFGNVNTSIASDGASFGYYGLPSNNSVLWAGDDAFKGTIYAPQATLTVGGGGSTIYDFQGAVVANAVVLNGHFNFHFDENLKKKGPQR